MSDDELKYLNTCELDLIGRIKLLLPWGFPYCDLLAFTYINVKIQGCAFTMDVMQLASIGIPIIQLIATKRNEPVSLVIKHLEHGSLHFYHIKDGLESFAANQLQ